MVDGRAQPRSSGSEWTNWRLWPESVAGLWRRSLQFRTVAITVGLTTIAILLSGIYLSVSVSNNLFQAKFAGRHARVNEIRKLLLAFPVALDYGRGVHSGGRAKSVAAEHRVVVRYGPTT